MFPAALAIVVQTFPLRERGKALALFFGIAGGLTAIGPILGGYLTQWTWRAIFWVNIPVAIIALVLIVVSKPTTEHRPARMDYRGLVLIAAGVGAERVRLPAVGDLGLGQPRHRACIVVGRGAAGRLLLRRAAHRVAADPGEHLQDPAVPGREPGARHLDARVRPGLLLRAASTRRSRSAKSRLAGRPLPPLLLHRLRRSPPRSAGGCSTGAAPSARSCSAACSPRSGSGSGPGKVTDLELRLAAVVHHPRRRRDGPDARPGQHRRRQPGVDGSPTARRPASPRRSGTTPPASASPSSARSWSRSCAPASPRRWSRRACPPARASAEASQHRPSPSGSGSVGAIPHFIRLDFAYATRSVLHVMAGVMAAAAIVAFVGLRRGVQEETDSSHAEAPALA